MNAKPGTFVNTGLLFLVILFTGCGAKKDETQATQDSVAVSNGKNAGFINIDSLQQEIDNAIQFQREELRAEPEKINGYLSRLDPTDPLSIPLAIHFIEGYPESPGAPVYDTLYDQFVAVYLGTAAQFDSIMNTEPYGLILNKSYDEPEDPQVKNLLSYFNLYSVKPGSGEGIYAATPDPDLFYNIFSKKASPALRDYLTIEKKENAEGFEVDAGLLIEYPQLYERVESWAKFMKDHKGNRLCEKALLRYQSYMRVMLFGMDNTPVFEDDVLSPDIKKLYQTIRREGKDSLSRRIISDYYDSLAADGFRNKGDLHFFEFLKPYHLDKAFDVALTGDISNSVF